MTMMYQMFRHWQPTSENALCNFISKTSQLMLFREITAVSSENQRNINSVQMPFNDKAGGIYSYHSRLKASCMGPCQS